MNNSTARETLLLSVGREKETRLYKLLSGQC